MSEQTAPATTETKINSGIAEATAVAQDKVAEVAHEQEQQAEETKEAVVKDAQEQAAEASKAKDDAVKHAETEAEAVQKDAGEAVAGVTKTEKKSEDSEANVSGVKKWVAKLKKLFK
ncbi:LADA_0E00782g1_1 [Lachancea dasiensis]|uniref:LADA_0E00782g1_1 n=1 Tax=Lachancea dasiensis TaxID=1072105 RepID=A0A1G4JA13_9SACH|nr:LADA_0E00782g1_1 [Lachancea dasiensis]